MGGGRICWLQTAGINHFLCEIVNFKVLNKNPMKTHYNFTAQIERDKETGLYVGMVPNLPGAFTQATSLNYTST